jgi:hypothetical protein
MKRMNLHIYIQDVPKKVYLLTFSHYKFPADHYAEPTEA